MAILLAVVTVVGCLAAGVAADYFTGLPADAQATYVGRQSCAECHREEVDKYTGSHHDLAMDHATPETVLGDFEDATLEHDGIVSRMFRRGERFFVHTEGPDGTLQDFEVKYVFGVTPLQQYMVEFDRSAEARADQMGRLQVLRISWDTLRERWFYLRPPDVADKLEPDDPLHWTGIAQRWQTMCADCHSTNLVRNFDHEDLTYHTTYSEIDVSCEACHGPASLHVEMARSRSLFWDRHHGFGLAKLKGEDPEPQLQTCAPCHSRRGVLTDDYQAGEAYCDHYDLELLREATYFPDGQVKDEDYVYGSFIQSKMYHKGIRCTDCHDPHSLELKQPGNATCTSCHQHPAGKYDTPAHHHHAPGTPGAACVNCHMPTRTYMDVDVRRDHSLRIPRPDLSVRLGTPNACSSCHVQDLREQAPESLRPTLVDYAAWQEAAADHPEVANLVAQADRWCDDACERWYGPERHRDPHFAEDLVAFRRGEPGSVDALLKLALADNLKAPAIARATALDDLLRMGGAPVQAAVTAETLLANEAEDPKVRTAAIRLLAALPIDVESKKRQLLKRLDARSRLERHAAAQALAAPDVYAALTASQRNRVDTALRDVHDALMATNDRAGSHLAWAGLCEQRGKWQAAAEAYEAAIRVEPQRTGARTNLAALLERTAEMNRGRVAPETLQAQQARARQLRKADLPLLERDAGLVPENAGLQYRLGLAYYLDGQMQPALEKLTLATELEPENPDFAQALRLLREKVGGGSAETSASPAER